MAYTKETIKPLIDKALLQVGILRAAGYDAHIVGGALRTMALGGETQDVDVAVILPLCDLWALRKDLCILLSPLGFDYILQHWSGYEDNKGFLADWRSYQDINIIAYDAHSYSSVADLVSKFDLNINQFQAISQHDDELINEYLVDSVVKVNPLRDNDSQANRLAERITRFKVQYSHLDWSEVSD